MKKQFFTGVVMLLLIGGTVQGQSAIHELNSGSYSAVIPGKFIADSVADYNLLSAYLDAGGKSAAMSWRNINTSKAKLFRNNLIGINERATGWADGGGNGPVYWIPVHKNHQLHLLGNVRTITNFNNLDGRIVGEVDEVANGGQAYPYTVRENAVMRFNSGVWTEVGMGYNVKLWQKKDQILSAGVNIKALIGAAHSSVNVMLYRGTVNLTEATGVSYLEHASGSVSTSTAGDFWEDDKPTSLLKGKLGIGVDMGVVFQSKRIEFGIAVSNIGQLRFSPDSSLSKEYDFSITDQNALYFNQNFEGLSPHEISRPLDENSEIFQLKSKKTALYKVSLPTTINVFARYALWGHWSARLSALLSLRRQNELSQLYTPHLLSFVPAYEKAALGLYFPLRYQQYAGFSAGFSVKYGRFFVGSSGLFSGLLDRSRRLDMFAGIAVRLHNPYYKSPAVVKREKDVVPDKEIPLKAAATLFAGYTTGNTVPYWLRSNHFGLVPGEGAGAMGVINFYKDYNERKKDAFFDWGIGVEVMGELNGKSNAQVIEGYAKVRAGIFEIRAGRTKDIIGLVDSSLSVGAFSVAGNTLGVPKIELRIPDYYSLPQTNGWLAVKGNIAHGWMGRYALRNMNVEHYLVDNIQNYMHQKSLYVRLGKEKHRVRLYGGVNHMVQWGNEQKMWGKDRFELSNRSSFRYVFLGNEYGNSRLPTSKIGNHLGSIDQAVEVRWGKYRLTGYHQFYYDIGGLYYLNNVKDGLWGLSLKNNNNSAARTAPHFSQLVLEFLYTQSQGGELDSRKTPSGAEDYYNNFMYYEGWTYKGENLGVNLMTNARYLRKELPQVEKEYIRNNRVMAVHTGFIIDWNKWNFKTLLTYSANKGTYATAPAVRNPFVEGGVQYNPPPYFPTKQQFSMGVMATRKINEQWLVMADFAADYGDLLYNSVGFRIGVKKSWSAIAK